MTLKELRTIIDMLDGMPDETEVIVSVNQYAGGVANVSLENAFKPDLKRNEVKLFTEVL